MLSSLAHTLSLSCRSCGRSQQPRTAPRASPLSSFSLLSYCCPLLLTAAPSYHALTPVQDTCVLSVARRLSGLVGFGLPTSVKVRLCCSDLLETFVWLLELFLSCELFLPFIPAPTSFALVQNAETGCSKFSLWRFWELSCRWLAYCCCPLLSCRGCCLASRRATGSFNSSSDSGT